MKFIKIANRLGFNHSHGKKYSVTDLARSDKKYNYEAGTDRMPRRDSKFRGFRYMIWDVAGNYKVN